MAFKSSGNFQRSQSKVWWGNQPERDEYGFVTLPSRTAAISAVRNQHYSLPKASLPSGGTSRSSKLTPPEIATTSWSYRRGSPGSFKSHDSGFSDSDQSPPNAAANVSASASSAQRDSSALNTSSSSASTDHADVDPAGSPNTPKRLPHGKSRPHPQQPQSVTSVTSSTSSERSTPPTVIRRKSVALDLNPAMCRRISFSAPNSPIYERIDGDVPPAETTTGDCHSPSAAKTFVQRKSPALKRSKAIMRRNNTGGTKSDRVLLRCVSQISVDSTGDDDFYQQAATVSVTKPADISANLDEPAVMMQTAIPQTPRSILKSDRPQFNRSVSLTTDPSTAAAATPFADTDSMNQTQHILPTYADLYPAQTSTPKASPHQPPGSHHRRHHNHSSASISPSAIVELAPTRSWDDFTYIEYSNPLLNGHSASIQNWLDTTRRHYAHEVLATLQTKSIVAQAVRLGGDQLTGAMAGRLIRQLQERGAIMQADFAYVERLLSDAAADADEALLKELPAQLHRLHTNVLLSVQKMSLRAVFQTATGSNGGGDVEGVRFRNNVACIADMSYDLVRVASLRDLTIETVQPLALLQDVQLLKRYVLITLRMVFERLVRQIVDRCEAAAADENDGGCDLLLRSHLCLLAQISNASCAGGMASLSDAFVATRAVRVLLGICADSILPSVRVLSLRALTTVACTRAAIRQLESCGGTELVAEILCDDGSMEQQQQQQQRRQTLMFRTEPETREALSVLAQMTAEWHGAEHRVDTVRPLVEALVARLTQLAERTVCCQTLLLAVAVLNNLARLETNAIWSLMSNETVLRVRAACVGRGPAVSVFLHEQIVGMIANMVNSKRSHPHLTNRPILNFLTDIYNQHNQHSNDTTTLREAERLAERQAKLRVTRLVLDIFGRLMRHQTAANRDAMEQTVALLFGSGGGGGDGSFGSSDSGVMHQRNLRQRSSARSADGSPVKTSLLESYV